MAGKEIKTLTYAIDLDSQGFTNGVKNTRKEMTAARKVLRDTIGPSEKFQNEVKKLDHLQKKGLISMDAYNRRLKQLNTNFKKDTASAAKFGKSVSGLGTAFKTAAIAFAGFMAVRFSVNEFTSRIDAMDQLAKRAALVGADPEFLQGLAFVADKTSGIDQNTVFTAIQKMQLRLGKARKDPAGEFAKIFKQLRIDAEKLKGAKPEEVFQRVAKAFREINDEQKKLALAEQLFEDAGTGILTTMELTTGEYDKQINRAKELGAIRTRQQLKEAENLQDQITDANAAINQVKDFGVLTTGQTIRGFQAAASSIPTENSALVDGDRSPVGILRMWSRDFAKQMSPFPVSSPGAGFTPVIDETDAALKAAEENRIKSRRAYEFIKGTFQDAGDVLKTIPGEVSRVQRDAEFVLGSAFNKRNLQRTRTTMQSATSLSDPADSITAGSSEAFKIMNRTKTTKSIEVKMQQKQVSLQEQTATAVTGLFELASREISQAVDL